MKSVLSNAIKTAISEEPISEKSRKIIGILFAILAVLFGSCWYVCSGTGTFMKVMFFPFFDGWINNNFCTKMEFAWPGFINSLWGLALCFPIYLRNFIPFKTLSPYSYISFVLNYLLFSVIAQLIFGRSGSFTFNTLNTVFIVSLVTSWIGIKSVAGFSWMAVFIVAFFSLLGADFNLHHFGSLFLLCAFSSLLFQSSFTPYNFLSNIVQEFKGIPSEKTAFVKESMAEAATRSAEIVKSSFKGF